VYSVKVSDMDKKSSYNEKGITELCIYEHIATKYGDKSNQGRNSYIYQFPVKSSRNNSAVSATIRRSGK
jgi:hypothetical protein